jgi:hypothetical protein
VTDTPDPLAAALAAVRERGYRKQAGAQCARLSDAAAEDVPRLVAAVERLLKAHRIEPLYAHADRGECGCPVPGEQASVADDIAYESAHPEGYGPDGTGLVCTAKVAGHWCPGCADVAVEHGCFEVPKAYPPGKCEVRSAISAALLGQDGATDAS